MSDTRALPGLPTSGPKRMIAVGLVLLGVMSIVRLITGFDNLTSSGTIGAALRLTVPILLAGLAGLWAERVGILN
ncbi:MAG: ABC transporter permease, partial [Ilumatobacter sp.]